MDKENVVHIYISLTLQLPPGNGAGNYPGQIKGGALAHTNMVTFKEGGHPASLSQSKVLGERLQFSNG